MSGIVVQDFERTPLADIAALAEFGVATIHEAREKLKQRGLRNVASTDKLKGK